MVMFLPREVMPEYVGRKTMIFIKMFLCCYNQNDTMWHNRLWFLDDRFMVAVFLLF